jgi:hypothetical protein
VKRELKLSMVENNVSFDNANFKVTWTSSTECKIIPSGLPMSSLWGSKGCEIIFAVGSWEHTQYCFNDKELQFTVIPAFESLNVTCNANGVIKVFTFIPPISNIEFMQNNGPSVNIMSGSPDRNLYHYEIIDQSSKEDIIDKSIKKYLSPIPLSNEWYGALKETTTILINIDDGLYFSSDFKLQIEPPEYSYFSPEAVDLESLVSPVNGYSAKFKLVPLSPRMRNFSGIFREENGGEMPFTVVDGLVELSFASSYDSNSTLYVKKGILVLDHYDKSDKNRPSIRFNFKKHCNFKITDNLERISSKLLIDITAAGGWMGCGKIAINKTSIADKEFIELHENEFNEFIFEVGKRTSISVEELRKEIPLIDKYFFSTYGEVISLNLIHIPFDNIDVFGEQIIPLKINREETIFETVRQYGYYEGGTEKVWQFAYNKEYYPEINKFKFRYCGVVFPLKDTSNSGRIMFTIPQPQFKEVEKVPSWEVQYGERIIRKEVVSIREITFDTLENEIALLSAGDNSKFTSIPVIGTTNSNGQPNIKIEINLKLGDKYEQIVATTAEVAIFEYWIIEEKIAKHFNKLHNQKGKIGEFSIRVPSRDQLLVSLPILGQGKVGSVLNFLSDWLINSWDGSLSQLDLFPELKDFLYAIILEDGKGIFNHRFLMLIGKDFSSSRGDIRLEQAERIDRDLKKKTTFLGNVLNIEGKFSEVRLNLMRKWCKWFAEHIHILERTDVVETLHGFQKNRSKRKKKKPIVNKMKLSEKVKGKENQQPSENIAVTTAKTPNTAPQGEPDSGLSGRTNKRNEAIKSMYGTADASGISNSNQNQQPSEKTSSRADSLAELRNKTTSKLNAKQHRTKEVPAVTETSSKPAGPPEIIPAPKSDKDIQEKNDYEAKKKRLKGVCDNSRHLPKKAIKHAENEYNRYVRKYGPKFDDYLDGSKED